MKSKLALAALSLLAAAAYAEQPTLELIMSDPDWIGNAPTEAYWADDGRSIYYQQKREGENFSDQIRQPLESASGKGGTQIGGQHIGAQIAEQLVDAELPRDSGLHKIYSPDRSQVVWLAHGDVFVKDLDSSRVKRVTATAVEESQPGFSSDGKQLHFLRDGQFFALDLASGALRQLSDLRLTDDPDAAPGFDTLRAHQLRTYTTVVENKRRSEAAARHTEATDLRPEPIYLGDDIKISYSTLSPSGHTLALITVAADSKDGRSGTMPNYVTADGYVATRAVRTRVGGTEQPLEKLWLVDLRSGKAEAVDFSTLPGITDDPLAELRRSALTWHTDHGADREQVAKLLQAPKQRGLSLTGWQWSPDGSTLAVQLLADDFKDRWLVTLAPAADKTPAPTLQQRLSDDAWINWDYNEFGWLSDSNQLWYLSEESGFSQLYVKPLDGKARQLTRGEFVVREPAFDPEEQFAYVVANRDHPGNYGVFRVPVAGGELQAVSSLEGVSSFALSPNGQQLLVSRSYFDRHPELYVGAADGSGELRQLTHTVSERYASIDWTVPKIVEVPSSHVEQPIYSKLYLPKDYDPAKTWPAVMFVHGAGYTQNAHMGWPYYFREFMFHTLLNNAGYIVIDMDYRASKGYGRDWRAAIYRNMGHPELEDFIDGVDYLANNYNVDRTRVGIYGGSYGGFMTFMALFRSPDTFAAGAALRPVGDWMNYEYGYTRRILNTPLIDPEAYQRSSPINHVAGLQAPLLIASGMQDDNVFFQDSVLMVQRLLELQKPDFEMAIYPLDGHGFIHPDSWLDEYRRIFRLMEANLK